MAQNAHSITKKNIVILGGSYGGVSTAHYLLKHAIPQLPVEAGYKIVLVSASSQVMCRPACPRALISDDMFPQEKLFVDIATAFEKYPSSSFHFICGTATALDHVRRNVTITLAQDKGNETLDFDALVIATGASTASPLLGLNHDFDSLRQSWHEFRQALSQAKSIVIAGGGPAAVETAGELGEYLNGRKGLEKPKVAITLVAGGSKILPALRPAIAQTAEAYLGQVGVTIIKNTRVQDTNPPGAGVVNVALNATLTLSDGRTLTTDLYIPATGTRPNTSFVDDSLLTPDGRVETNTSTLRVDKAGPRIYAIGDASSYARPAVHNILAAVPILCANIKRDLLLTLDNQKSSASNDRLFKEDTRETQMVPIGKSKGVGAAMGYRLPSFLVWLIKGRDYWLWTTGKLWSGDQWAKES
ncbi:amid-like mitochondrial oxidoreductase [Colletotrichum truncatum]|uniref:Amid-like mitochondrial oxidoreductase n=1 Tax=Colletotrichum truncatum TaxID=5467 RepID=A0ACC3YK36_COLTU|nr:amid-like mitochondrial oxidoreductase [Colletotrichum truncatum]KAF6784342.1 amid-like mitochondrial oxidoreductase [Colletotrichum truncatum]